MRPATPPDGDIDVCTTVEPDTGSECDSHSLCQALSSQLVVGENGHAALSAEGLGDSLLALFDKLVRGADAGDDSASVGGLVEDVLTDARVRGDTESVKNLFVMAFQTRWCRGGKAEKKLFYTLLRLLYARFPVVVRGLVHLIPEYGYWKDLLLLLAECQRAQTRAGVNAGGDTRGHGSVDYSPLHADVWTLFAQQLKTDAAELARAGAEHRLPKLSLCAKYAPSERGTYSKTLQADRKICELLFRDEPDCNGSRNHVGAKYRRMLSRLRKQLTVTETFMCTQRWHEIDFERVPSLCMNRQKHAFLNEDCHGKTAHPKDILRVLCRQNLIAHIAHKGILALKGKQLFPHELVQQVIITTRKTPLSTAAAMVLDVQWAAMRNGVLEQVNARRSELARAAAPVETADALALAADACPELTVLSIARDAAIDAAVASGAARPTGLGRVVPMADTSGSMEGTPMMVSIALGILASEVTHESFRDKVLTFHENPTWHDLSGCTSFVKKVSSLRKSAWGGSTNFYGAMVLIADVVRKEKLRADEIPDLLVISDMQFNEAQGRGSWTLSQNKIKRMFADLGNQLHGAPFDPPQIIFWNVRSGVVGYPASADSKGVVMLSGFSPSLMKFVLSGEMEEEVIVGVDSAGNAIKEKVQTCPKKTLCKILQDSGLEKVRAALDAMPAENFSLV